MKLDAVAFGAHPDDVELLCGGTIIKLVKLGYKVGIIDLTEGDKGTRGSVEERYQEAENSKNIMGVHIRENLRFPDCGIKTDIENRNRIISIIRKYRPSVVFSPNQIDRHPDHNHASKLVEEAVFYSGVMNILPDEPAFRPNTFLMYAGYYEFEPDFVVNISNEFETKMEAILAYKSQVHNPEKTDEPETFISSKFFLDFIKNKFKYWGNRIRKEYGEPFKVKDMLEIEDPVKHFSRE